MNLDILIAGALGWIGGTLFYHAYQRRADREIDAVVRSLVTALKPFADHAAHFYAQPDSFVPDNVLKHFEGESRLTLKDFRRAFDALNGGAA